MNLHDVLVLEAAQELDLEATEKIATEAERKIASFASLPADVRATKIAEVRTQALTEIGPLRNKSIERARTAESMAPEFEPDAFRRGELLRAAERIAPQLNLLRRVSTLSLIDYAADAVARNDVALAEAVRLEWSSRADVRPEHNMRFAHVFARLNTSDADEARQRLAKVRGHERTIESLAIKIARGQVNPIARLTAARTGQAA